MTLSGSIPMCDDGQIPLLKLGDVVNCIQDSDCPKPYLCEQESVLHGACCPMRIPVQKTQQQFVEPVLPAFPGGVAQRGPVRYSCERQPYKAVCPGTGLPAQFSLRWYLKDGKCCSYPWGHCKGEDEIATENAIRYKEDCEAICIRGERPNGRRPGGPGVIPGGGVGPGGINGPLLPGGSQPPEYGGLPGPGVGPSGPFPGGPGPAIPGRPGETVQKSCERFPYRAVCATGLPSQFTLRWYLRDGKCCSYPWGHCKGEDEVANEPSIRTKEECQAICLGRGVAPGSRGNGRPFFPVDGRGGQAGITGPVAGGPSYPGVGFPGGPGAGVGLPGTGYQPGIQPAPSKPSPYPGPQSQPQPQYPVAPSQPYGPVPPTVPSGPVVQPKPPLAGPSQPYGPSQPEPPVVQPRPRPRPPATPRLYPWTPVPTKPPGTFPWEFPYPVTPPPVVTKRPTLKPFPPDGPYITPPPTPRPRPRPAPSFPEQPLPQPQPPVHRPAPPSLTPAPYQPPAPGFPRQPPPFPPRGPSPRGPQVPYQPSPSAPVFPGPPPQAYQPGSQPFPTRPAGPSPRGPEIPYLPSPSAPGYPGPAPQPYQPAAGPQPIPAPGPSTPYGSGLQPGGVPVGPSVPGIDIRGGVGPGQTGAVQKTCDRIPYKAICASTGLPSQFTLRWYVRDGKCCSYPWGHCKGEDEVANEPSIRTKEECECFCLNRCSR